MRTTWQRTVITTMALGVSLFGLTSCIAGPPAVEQDEKPGLARIAEELVQAGYPAALMARTDPDGSHHLGYAGLADRESEAAVQNTGEVRIGSATKTFTAVAILQLVQEGRFGLDDSIESLLPGVVMGEGIDPSLITVRQLLQHTSGLPDYADLIAADPFAQRDVYRSPRDMVELALERPASFAPGEKYEYTNTGYLVLGLIIERVTQRPYAEQIHDRIIEPLGLTHTYMPLPGEREIRGEHPHGYHRDEAGDLADISVADPSWTWAAGAMVSTPSELNDFMRAVLNGQLLEERMLSEMLTGIATGEELLPGSTYGLGIESVELSCGTAWGHSGDIPGYQTRNAVLEDGTAFTTTVTALPWAIFDGPEDELLQRYLVVIDTLDRALCENDSPSSSTD